MSKMNFQKINWDRIERVALYGSIIMFVLSLGLSAIIPSIEEFLPKQSPLILLSTTLLIAIHYLIKIIETSKEADGYSKHATFTSAFNQLLSHETHISDLAIVAYTSTTWFEHVRLCGVKIDRLRLLLFYDRNFLSKNIEGELQNSNFNIDIVIARWNRLVEDQQIGNLEIRRIGMAPPIYFGIINREKGIFGYLWPRRGISGLEPKQAAFLYSKSDFSTTMLNHSKEWFDSVWNIADKVR